MNQIKSFRIHYLHEMISIGREELMRWAGQCSVLLMGYNGAGWGSSLLKLTERKVYVCRSRPGYWPFQRFTLSVVPCWEPLEFTAGVSWWKKLVSPCVAMDLCLYNVWSAVVIQYVLGKTVENMYKIFFTILYKKHLLGISINKM